MAKYLSRREKSFKIGISSYSENLTSLEVIGRVGIGTTNASANLQVNGSVILGATNSDLITIPGRISSNFYPNGDGLYDVGRAPEIGSGANRWRNANFTGKGTFDSGVDARNIEIGVGAANLIYSTSGNLELNAQSGITNIDDIVTISENLGVGTNNPTSKLWVNGDSYFVGVVTATTFYGDGSQLTNVSFAGISSYADNAGISSNIKGGSGGSIPYQIAEDQTSFIPNGPVGYILQSNGGTNIPSWEIAAPSNAITGLTVRDEGFIVGLANSVSQLNFVGPDVTVTSTGNIATITYSPIVGITSYADISGISTNVIGGIASVSRLRVTGVSTLGFVTATSLYSVGIVTASSFIPTSGFIKAPDGTDAFYMYSGTGNVAFQGTIGASKINNASGYLAIDFSSSINPTVLIPNNLGVSGIATVSNRLGIGTTNPTSSIHVVGDGLFTGIVTASSFSGNASSASFATVAGVATALQNSRTISLSGDVVGSVSFNGTSDVSIAATIQPNSVGLGSDTTGNYVASITNGSYITGGDGGSEGSILTIGVAATSLNTSNQVVARDGLGNFSANVITANLTGTATTATNLSNAENITAGTINSARLSGTYDINVSYAITAGIATYATLAGIATYAHNAGIATYAETAGISTYASNAGVATGLTTTSNINTSGIITAFKFYGDGSGLTGLINPASGIGINSNGTLVGYAATIINFSSGILVTPVSSGISTVSIISSPYSSLAGIASYADTAGIATYATLAGISTALQNSRTFEITGDIVASAISFDGTGNVSLAATIQPNSVGLGTDTTGDYVQSISGTANQITVTNGNGEGSTPVISIPSNPTLPGNVTISNDLQVNNNLNVTGNITVGGTTGYLIVQDFKVSDADIIVGFTTNGLGQDVSNDTTANHGGISIASTEGNPLVQLVNVAIGESLPATYKKIMWFKSGAFAGLNTDAWLFNYGVGIGSTQLPSGTRLAAGAVRFTENDLAVVRNINASGVITATTFVGQVDAGVGSITTLNSTNGTITNLSGTIGTVTTLNSTNGTITNLSGTIGTVTTLNSTNGTITNLSGTIGTIANLNSTNINVSGVVTASSFNGNATSASYATLAGVATYASNAGISTNIKGGSAGVIPYQSATDVTSFTQVGTAGSILISNGTNAPYWGSISNVGGIGGISILDEGVSIGSSITSLNFIGPNVTVSVSGSGSTITIADYVSIAGVSTNVIGGIGSVAQLSVSGISTLGVVTSGSIFSTGVITATSFSGNATSATFATTSGVSTSVIGGIGSVTQLSVSGITTTALFNVGTGGTIITTTSDGRIGIGTTIPSSKLYIVGDAFVTGVITSTDYNSTSDIKLKTDISIISNSLDKVSKLNGVEFIWKETGKKSAGVIAQEVEKVLPNLVSGDETKTVNYNGLIGLLIECIKEQQKEIDFLKQNILS